MVARQARIVEWSPFNRPLHSNRDGPCIRDPRSFDASGWDPAFLRSRLRGERAVLHLILQG